MNEFLNNDNENSLECIESIMEDVSDLVNGEAVQNASMGSSDDKTEASQTLNVDPRISVRNYPRCVSKNPCVVNQGVLYSLSIYPFYGLLCDGCTVKIEHRRNKVVKPKKNSWLVKKRTAGGNIRNYCESNFHWFAFRQICLRYFLKININAHWAHFKQHSFINHLFFEKDEFAR